jgi:F-type H+-transporting ATPase subunit delta
MGASTRASLDNLRAQVGTLAASDELVSGVCEVGRAIAHYPSLLQALADNGHSVDERTALLAAAMPSVPANVREVVASVVAQNWSKPADFLAGVEELAVRLASKAAGSADVTGELLEVGRVIRGHSDLQLAMSDKRAQAEAKMALAHSLFGTKVSSAAMEITKHLVALPRGRRVSDALSQAASVVADQQGLGLAEVRVASSLAAAQETSLRETLKKRFGRDHYLDVVVDPEVIGGVRIRVGDVVIDASVSKQLSDMRIQLAS